MKRNTSVVSLLVQLCMILVLAWMCSADTTTTTSTSTIENNNKQGPPPVIQEHRLLDALETFAQMASVSTNQALELISSADWEEVWFMQDLILDIVVSSGKLAEEEYKVYQNDEAIWEKELKLFYDEFQKRGAAAKNDEDEEDIKQQEL